MISPKAILLKAARLTVIGIIIGWVFAWVSPHMFPRDKEYGVAFGALHGAMMPIALPSLIMGKNVEIFGTPNTGRGYKIGYICGINFCGLIFFGSAFWKPSKKPAPVPSIGETSDAK